MELLKKILIFIMKRNKDYNYFTISQGNKIVAYHFYKVRQKERKQKKNENK